MNATGGLGDIDPRLENLINKVPSAVEYACKVIDLMDDQLKIEKED